MTGTIFDIKELAVHDGPGLRTTVFLKGCPLRCRWCHNPEGLSSAPQMMFHAARCRDCGACRKTCEHEICKPYGRCIRACPENCMEIAGRAVTALELSKELISSAQVLGDHFGGFTFSGGEPLFQPDFLLETAKHLSGFHLCMETSGYADADVFKAAAQVMDLVIMDVKLADGEAHKRYTGKTNEKILKNLSWLQASHIPHILRTPLIPGITDTEENLKDIKTLIGTSTWDKIPYNGAAGAKYEMLGMKYSLDAE